MNKDTNITLQEFAMASERIALEYNKSRLVYKKAYFCATMGHIAFCIVLAMLSFLCGFLLVGLDDNLKKLPWLLNLESKIVSALFISEAQGIEIILYLLITIICLLVVPFAICLIAKLFFPFVRVRSYRAVFERLSKEINYENAKSMLDYMEIIEFNSHPKWYFFYPKYEIDIGDSFSINLFNLIPYFILFLPMIIMGISGTTTDNWIIYLIMVGFALVVCAIALFIIVPLWKLSSIVNSLLYRTPNTVVFMNEFKAKLESYIKENIPSEPKKNNSNQNSNTKSKGNSSGLDLSEDKGLNTYYTDIRNGQSVYYKNGEYVNEDGTPVPTQWIDD